MENRGRIKDEENDTQRSNADDDNASKNKEQLRFLLVSEIIVVALQIFIFCNLKTLDQVENWKNNSSYKRLQTLYVCA